MSALQIGMLWQCETPTLANDIARAAEYYRAKYGKPVNAVHVPEGTDTAIMAGSIINVIPDKNVRPGTLWIGWAGPQPQPPATTETPVLEPNYAARMVALAEKKGKL